MIIALKLIAMWIMAAAAVGGAAYACFQFAEGQVRASRMEDLERRRGKRLSREEVKAAWDKWEWQRRNPDTIDAQFSPSRNLESKPPG